MRQKNLLTMILVSAGSIACWQAAQSAPKDSEKAEFYRLFVDAVEHVDRNYVKEVNRRELIEKAIEGMLESLDPYSNFIPPTEVRNFDRQTTGKFAGIGISIDMRDGFLTVAAPLYATPAYNAGIIAGDRFLAVNGENIQGMSQNDVVDRLQGEPGSDVAVTIQHAPYNSKPIELKLKRAVISVESVLGNTHKSDDKWDFILDPKDKIAYIRITSFVQNTKSELDAALKEASKAGMKALVVDLRYNPGGLLTAAIDICDLFVKDGMIVSTKGRTTETKEYRAKGTAPFGDIPVAILVNGFSASASEIMSSCLQDHHRAVIVGERTWGKGSVQNVIELEDGKSKLKLTTASYHRPNGHNIHKFKNAKDTDEWGVKPDANYEVKFTTEDHRNYTSWRRNHDLIKGKASAVSEAEAASKLAAAAATPVKADPKPDATGAKPEAKANAPATKAANRREPPKEFNDKQLNKALEYIRAELAKKTKVAA